MSYVLCPLRFYHFIVKVVFNKHHSFCLLLLSFSIYVFSKSRFDFLFYRSRVLRFCMWPLDDTDVVQRPVFERLVSHIVLYFRVGVYFVFRFDFHILFSSVYALKDNMNEQLQWL